MSRRRKDESAESTFGSDSFQDVVANIVGILIILIVLVGVRVRHAPPTKIDDSESSQAEYEAVVAQWKADKAAIDEENKRAAVAYQRSIAEKDLDVKSQQLRLAARLEEQAKLDRELNEHEAERLRREEILRQYEDEARQLQAQLAELAQRLNLVRQQRTSEESARHDHLVSLDIDIERRTQEAARLSSQIEDERRGLSASAASGEELQRRIIELRELIEKTLKETPETKPLRHYATPLARRVQKEELHFRCKNGRLAYTYLNELFKDVGPHARARMTMSTSRLEGIVGPRGGFSLKYVIASPMASVSQQLTELHVSRMALIYWELGSDSDDFGETIDEVLEPNSAFRVKLRSTSAFENSITLWVHDDSFELARKVEEFLHTQGFTVALRPLPGDMPIIGSPAGTASHSH